MPAVEYYIDDDSLLDEIFDLDELLLEKPKSVVSVAESNIDEDSLLNEIFDLSEFVLEKPEPVAPVKVAEYNYEDDDLDFGDYDLTGLIESVKPVESVAEAVKIPEKPYPENVISKVEDFTFNYAPGLYNYIEDGDSVRHMLKIAGVPIYDDAVCQSHLLSVSGHKMKIACRNEEDFIKLCEATYYARQAVVFSNPGKSRPRYAYFDFDCDKDGKPLSQKQIDAVMFLLDDVFEEIYGRKIQRLVLDKTNNKNLHIVYKVVLKTSNTNVLPHYQQRVIVSRLHAKIRQFQILKSEMEAVIKACDNAVGIRALYCPKQNNPDDFYKPIGRSGFCETFHGHLRDWMTYDPCWVNDADFLEPSLDFLMEAETLERESYFKDQALVADEDYYNEEQIPEIFDIIEKIPIKGLSKRGYWGIVLAQVKSALIRSADMTDDDEDYNRRVLAAFDARCSLAAGYNAVDNKRMYKSSQIQMEGYKILQTKHAGKAERAVMRAAYLQHLIDAESFKTTERLKKRADALKFGIELPKTSKYDENVVNELHTNFPLNSGAIVKASTGTGKSYMSRKFLDEAFKAKPNLKVLMVGNRIKLLKKTQELLESHKFIWYDKLTPGAPSNRVISTCESLHLVENVGEFDYVFMDEFCGIIAQLDSPNFNFPVPTMQAFQILFNSSAEFVLMDAYMNDKYLDILFKNFPGMKVPKYFINEKQNKLGEEMVILVEKTDVLRTIKHLINEKQQIVFCADKVKDVEVIGKILAADGETLILTGDRCRAKEMQEILSNPELIKNYKHFCYSPVIESGFSIEIEHFDIQVSCFTYGQTSLIGNLQMLNRVRVKRNRKSFVYFDKRGDITTAEQIVKKIADRACNVDISNSITEFGAIPWEKNWKVVHPVAQMIVDYRVQKSCEIANFAELFITGIHEQGYKISVDTFNLSDDTKKKDRAEFELICENINKEKAEKIAASNIVIKLDKKTDRDIIDGKLTEDELLGYQKSRISHTYRIPFEEVDADFVLQHGKPRKMAEFSRLARLMRLGIEGEIARIEDRIAATKNLLADAERAAETEAELNFNRLHAGISLQDKRIAMCLMQEFYGPLDKLDELKLRDTDILARAANISIPDWRGVGCRFKLDPRAKCGKFGNFNEIPTKRGIVAAVNSITAIFGLALKPTNKHCTFYKVVYKVFKPDWVSFMEKWNAEDEAKSRATLEYPPLPPDHVYEELC